jgi:hypothetical protein
LKYAGVTAAVTGASALGFDYLSSPRSSNLSQITTTGTTSTLDRTPPVIKGFQFQPTRVVNGKVYNATISFSVEDQESAIGDVNATLQDYGGTIPSRAYPAEPTRILQLTPSQTLTRTVSYSAAASDLKGGKQYSTKIAAKDSAGNETNWHFETPYVREFENIAMVDRVIVGASYFFFDACYFPTSRTPLLGCHYPHDNLTMAKQIDWATGHCVGLFFVSWDWPQLIKNIPALVKHPLGKDLRFAILYDTVNRLKSQKGSADFDKFYAENQMTLRNDFDSFCNNLFPLEQFHVVDNKPMVYFYNSANILGEESKVADVFVSLRRYVKEAYGIDLYFISDHVQSWASPEDHSWTRRISPFDAITSWGGSFYGKKTDMKAPTYEEHLDQLYDAWSRWAKGNGKGFIPSFKPSENTTRVDWGSPDNYILPRSPQLFQKRVEILLKYMDPKLRMIRIDTWNDWYENTEIEPSVEEGLTYLNLLKDEIAHS